MSSVRHDKALAMFFDKDFSPTEYVDALMLTLADPTDKYLGASLARISGRVLDLLSHLDYSTGEISKELANNMAQLQKLAQPVAGADESTRLEYYFNSLRNSVQTLEAEVKSVLGQLSAKGQKEAKNGNTENDNTTRHDGEDTDPVQTLILLNTVHSNIGRVLLVLQNLRRLFPGVDVLAIGVDEFLSALNVLHDTIRAQAREGDEDERAELEKTVAEMKSWTPMFLQFSQFGPLYSRFILRTEAEL